MPARHPGTQPEAGPFIVLTGGPGSGKTTLIEELRALGLATAPEAGRAIIKEQVAIGGPALPWADGRLFTETILSWEMRTYRLAEAMAGPVFFDRGVPDVAGGYPCSGWRALGTCGPPSRRSGIPDGIHRAAVAGDLHRRHRAQAVVRGSRAHLRGDDGRVLRCRLRAAAAAPGPGAAAAALRAGTRRQAGRTRSRPVLRALARL